MPITTAGCHGHVCTFLSLSRLKYTTGIFRVHMHFAQPTPFVCFIGATVVFVLPLPKVLHHIGEASLVRSSVKLIQLVACVALARAERTPFYYMYR